ncbi:MAG: hypothetical protein IKZ48_02225 [Prevotella sp.]|nr:hypothetical protein [Prevotella sp.]
MKRLLFCLSFIIFHISFSIAQNDDIEVTDSTSNNWGGGSGGELNIQKPILSLSLNDGWNWVSHPLKNSVAVSTILGEDGYRVLSQTKEMINDDAYGWVGNLSELVAGQCYKVQMTGQKTVTLPIDELCTEAISLRKGWNWVGYNYNFSASLSHALQNNFSEEGDIIFGKGSTAIFFGGQWIGDIESIIPGQGYMYKSVSNKMLVYNNEKEVINSSQYNHTLHTQENNPIFTVDNSKYSSQMSVIGKLYSGNEPLLPWTVGAFCGDVCRGVSNVVSGLLFISIGGEIGDIITFRTIDNDGVIREIKEELNFDGDMHGSPLSPVALHVNYDQTGIETSVVHTSIIDKTYDLNGRRIRDEKGLHSHPVRIVNKKKVVSATY